MENVTYMGLWCCISPRKPLISRKNAIHLPGPPVLYPRLRIYIGFLSIFPPLFYVFSRIN